MQPKVEGDREQRTVIVPLELRDDTGDENTGATARGYAVLFGVQASIGGFWHEQIQAGAFAKSLSERDVIAVHSHDIGRVVGRMNAGTLTIKEDAKGLAFENVLPDTTDGRDLAVQIGRGDIAGMSFAFRALKESWDDSGDIPLRTVIEAELHEITYTAFPAYPDTSVGLRSLDQARTDRRAHNRVAASARISARRAQQMHRERGI